MHISGRCGMDKIIRIVNKDGKRVVEGVGGYEPAKSAT